jgi:ABC-2 type transport system ATP-binding protein
MNDNEVVISVNNVSKDFKLPHQKVTSIKSLFINPFHRKSTETQHSLRGISLEVKKGDFFGIIGRNGCGKSTLLKMIAGIYQPTKGSIKVNGKISPFLELGVGFNPELTGRENVFLNGALLGFSKKEMLAMYNNIVKFAELEQFMDQKLLNYSSGMQVRLAFSVAIQAKADILLIDEVLAVGDAAFMQKCFDYFLKLKKEKVTVVFITHDMEAMRRFCDKAAYIKNGVIQEIGTPSSISELYVNENFGENSSLDIEAQNTNKLPIQIKMSITGGPEIKIGDKVTCQILLESTIKEKVVLAASILRNGEYVGGFNTRKYTRPIEVKPGRTSFEANIETVSLNAGYYTVGVGIYAESNFKPLGLMIEGPRIHITSDAAYKDGIANIDGEIVNIDRN